MSSSRYITGCKDEIYFEPDRSGYIFHYSWTESKDRDKFISKVFSGEVERYCGCGRLLDAAYLYIIYKLKEAGLLYESYKIMCCFCHMLACIGLEIPEEWENVSIDFSTEIGTHMIGGITVRKTFYSKECHIMRIKGVYKPTNEHFKLLIRIHDTDKFIKTGRMIEDVKLMHRVW